MKKLAVDRVRALSVDETGGVFLMTANEDHVLQLPGGGVKPGESLEEAVIREVGEETGHSEVEVLAQSLPVTVKRDGRKETSVCFRVRVTGSGEPQLTRQEKARGLRPTRFDDVEAAVQALQQKAEQYGRPAVLRDLALIEAVRGA